VFPEFPFLLLYSLRTQRLCVPLSLLSLSVLIQATAFGLFPRKLGGLQLLVPIRGSLYFSSFCNARISIAVSAKGRAVVSVSVGVAMAK
jgi:hypothetical protein